MNKKGLALTQSILLVLGIIAFAFIFGSEFRVVSANDASQASGDSCHDTDGGREKNVFGTVNLVVGGLKSTLPDACLENGEVREWFCKGNAHSFTDLPCGSGYICQSGACVKETPAEGADPVVPPKTNTPPVEGYTGGILDDPVVVAEQNKDEKKLIGKLSDDTSKLLGAASGVAKANDIKEALKKQRQSLDELGANGDEQQIADTKANIDALEDALQKEELADANNELKALMGPTSFLGKFAKGFIHKVPMKSQSEILRTAAQDAQRRALEAAGKDVTTEINKELITKAGEKAAKTTTSTLGYATYAVAWAAMGATISSYAAKAIGASERNERMITSGAWVAAGTTAVAATIIASSGTAVNLGFLGTIAAGTGPPGWMVAGATIVLTAFWGVATYQNYAQEVFVYESSLWQPPKGGEVCQECNQMPYGCSEYQCRSFGAGCVILNPGTEHEACEWNNSRDFNPPQITQLDILDVNYEYNPMKEIQLPDRGVKIVYTGRDASSQGCIPAFTGVKFGVKTDEPAQCKIDLERKYSFDQMLSFMNEGTVYTYNHTLTIPSTAFPSQYALNEAGWTIDTGKEQNFFIRCEDANGNLNPMHFVVNFCVDDGPDTTPPEIETNYLENAYIKSGTLEIDDLEVYTNEPAECRWDFIDRDYEQMENEMNECSTALGEYTFPASYQYGCKGVLTGIKDGVNNNYFIRCKDKPKLNEETAKEKRIANEQSYKLTLIGTKPLAISAIALNNEVLYEENAEDKDFKIVDSTMPVKATLTVKTLQGAQENGNARCAYKSTGTALFYEFYNKGSFNYTYQNTHDLHLGDGNYNYDIRCCDIANNCDTEQISFEIETDTTPPEISRAYYEDKTIKLITTEAAECVYSTSTCNYLFADGLSLETRDNLNHYSAWDTTTNLHVKCKDKYGNLPGPKSCQITVRAYEEYSGSDK